jgi:hypothetical protein
MDRLNKTGQRFESQPPQFPGEAEVDLRLHYRKRVRSSGMLAGPDGEEMAFLVRDLSLNGFLGVFDKDPKLPLHQSAYLRLPELGIKGVAIPRWAKPDWQGRFRVGFEFVNTRNADS